MGNMGYVPLVQRLIDAGLDERARNSQGNTPIFGYVAIQPEHDTEYDQGNIHPDLEEQRQVIASYDFRAINIAGETLLHLATERRRHVGLQEDTKNMLSIL